MNISNARKGATMPLAHQEGFRKGLLPKWVRFFAWLFLVIGSAMPALLVSGIIYPSPMQFSLFGWEHSGSPYDAYSLLVVAYFAASGVAAFGMLWGRRWGWAAAFIVGSIGLLLSLGSMFIRPLMQEDDGAYTVYIRLEPLLQIPFLYVLWRIRQSWLSPSVGGDSEGTARSNAPKVIAGLVSATSVIVIIALAVISSLTSGMIEVASQFFDAVKESDVAKARTWLSSEAQATTDEIALRQFLVQSETLGAKTANWPVRQVIGQRGELKGTVTNADGEVPMVLTFVKEDGQWKILTLLRPPVSPNPKDMQALRTRAEGGDANAQAKLGGRYLQGLGVEKSGVEAEKWFRKAAEQGSATAQYSLALMYDEGQVVQADKPEALKWYLKSAQQGFAKAQYNLGYNYAHGDGVERNYAEALSWYRKAADQGFASAQLSLGTLYMNGVGVPKDDAEAVAWFEKAAAQGVAHGQFAMGDAYARGRGIQRDEKAAVEWYRKAADQGLASAQDRLATTYSQGSGIAKSDKEAYYWWLLAVRNDEKKRDQLYVARYPLTPEEIIEVEGRAAKWQPKSAPTSN
jgi:TPR repeat protein